MKEDVGPLPDRVPRKRRVIETLPDLHIAMWLADESLAPGDRKRLQEEKDRRKRLSPDNIVGFVDNPEGMTPQQREMVQEILGATKPTKAIHRERYSGSAKRFHGICLTMRIPVELIEDEREIVKQSDLVLVTPKDHREPTAKMDGNSGVWWGVRYARHRGVPVKVILPNGEIYQGERSD